MSSNLRKRFLIGLSMVSTSIIFLTQVPSVYAQQSAKIEDLRNRVKALEDYTQTLQAAMNDFSKDLVKNVDQQLQAAASKSVLINPLSRKVVKVDTNTGTLLISAQRMDKIDKGYRIYLQVGNPNAASYGDLKLRFFWGNKWEEQSGSNSGLSYEKWRQSLIGAEYVYSGLLESGSWTDIAVDIKPAEYNQLQHLECEIEVNTVKLQKIKGPEVEIQSSQ